MRHLFIVLCAAALIDCDHGPSPTVLTNTRPSIEALAGAVLDAFAERNIAALRGLAVDEREFRELVWPELPASRPERNLPFSYVWGDLRQKSEQSLAQTLAGVGGRRLTLVSVRFSGETTRYPSYAVHRETTLSVRDGEGNARNLQAFGSALEKDGEWKVFSYVVD